MARVSVAGIRTFVEGSKSGTVHVGVDVHKRSYSVALLRAVGAWKERAGGKPPPLSNASPDFVVRNGSRCWPSN
jgi:hypothetical protein